MSGRIYDTGYDIGPIPASKIDVNTSMFTGHLSIFDDNVQKALETLDQLEINSSLWEDDGTTHIKPKDSKKVNVEHIDGAFKLDQTTPQDVVPYAGTTFSLTNYDALPNIAPNAFNVPAIAFTNSNALGISPYVGAIRGGTFMYAYDGNDAVIGLINDVEADQLSIMSYDSNNLWVDMTIQSGEFFDTPPEIRYMCATNAGDTVGYPVIGGADSDDNRVLLFDTSIGIWDSQNVGGVTLYGVSQDFSTMSEILLWGSSTETLVYFGAGGMYIVTKGSGGDTDTALALKYKILGGGADNDGIRLSFSHRSDEGILGAEYTAGYIDCIQTDASEGTMDSCLAFGGYTDGASGEWLRLTGSLGTFNTDLKVVTGTNTYFETDQLTVDLTGLVPDLYITAPILKGIAHSTLPETLPFPYAVGIYDRFAIFAQGDFAEPEIMFAYPDFSSAGSIGVNLDYGYFWVDWGFYPRKDDIYDLGVSELRWRYGWFSKDINIYADTYALKLGAGADMSVYYDGTNGNIDTDLVAASDLVIDCGTDKTVVLEETVWDDIQFSVSTGKTPAANHPDFDTFTDHTKEYKFDVDDYIYLAANEMSHWWKEGTAIYPHIHITTDGANASGSSQYVKFTLYITYADTNEVWTETSIDIEKEIPDGTADMTHLLATNSSVALTNNLIGTQVKIRLERIAATTGTEYPNHIFVTQVGFHCEKDTMGSRQIAVK